LFPLDGYPSPDGYPPLGNILRLSGYLSSDQYPLLTAGKKVSVKRVLQSKERVSTERKDIPRVYIYQEKGIRQGGTVSVRRRYLLKGWVSSGENVSTRARKVSIRRRVSAKERVSAKRGPQKYHPTDTLSGYLPPWRILSLGKYPPPNRYLPSIADTSSPLDTSPQQILSLNQYSERDLIYKGQLSKDILSIIP